MKSHKNDRYEGPEISIPDQRRLEKYIQELYRWNMRLNLTAVPREEAWRKHIEEPLTVLEEQARGDKWSSCRVADLGSGCGAPGIPFAIAFSPSQMVLIEKEQKKAAFLTHMAGLLEQPGLEIANGLAENLAVESKYHEAFDLVITRAAGPPERVIQLALPLLKHAGKLMAMAHVERDEISLLDKATKAQGATLEQVTVQSFAVVKG